MTAVVVYDVLVALHVVSAVAGFGAVAISGVYGSIARRPERPGAPEETRRYFQSPGRAEWLVLAVPVLGAAALGARPAGADFGQAWVIAAAVVWLAAAALLLGAVRPAEAEIRTANAAGESAPAAGRRLMWTAAASDLLFVVALVLMVGQPG
ncbi:MAG TPA: DUF2269 family protein [Acidimicrobiales bacterium]